MNFRNSFLALVLLLAGAVRLGSQSVVLDVDQVPIEGPPAQKEILSVLMDGGGFIWIGSQDGLARYDGYRVVPCRIDVAGGNAAGGLPVRAMCEGPAGRLWLATDRGLVRYDPGSGHAVRFRHDPRRRESISTDDLTCVHIAPALPGRLWIAGENGSIDELDLGNDRITRHAPIFTAGGAARPERILALGSDPAGILWIGAADGLYRYLPQEGLLRPCPCRRPSPDGGIACRSRLSSATRRPPTTCGSAATTPGFSSTTPLPAFGSAAGRTARA